MQVATHINNISRYMLSANDNTIIAMTIGNKQSFAFSLLTPKVGTYVQAIIF